jgi:hypothetical protein
MVNSSAFADIGSLVRSCPPKSDGFAVRQRPMVLHRDGGLFEEVLEVALPARRVRPRIGDQAFGLGGVQHGLDPHPHPPAGLGRDFQ